MLERLVMLKDVATGLQELHNQDAVHGDLVSGERLCFGKL
jgi:tRNA A-37 threonylcarbamoyl transferase component Bud32